MSISNHILTSAPMDHIWPKDGYFCCFLVHHQDELNNNKIKTFFHLFSFSFYSVGNFLVVFCICAKTSLSAKPFMTSAYWFLFYVNQSHFHMNGFARRLVFKQRHKETFIHELSHGRLWFFWFVIRPLSFGLGIFSRFLLLVYESLQNMARQREILSRPRRGSSQSDVRGGE